MTAPLIHTLNSLDDLRASAADWNELWSRSPAARPTARAEQVALWCEAFAPEDSFRAVVIESAGRWVGALPLIVGRRYGMACASNVGNCWSPGGELLLDPAGDSATCRAVCNWLRQTRLGLVALCGMVSLSPAAVQLQAALPVAGLACNSRRHFATPLIEIAGPWNDYLASRSRNLRRQLHRIAQRDQASSLTLERFEHGDLATAQAWLADCWKVEAAGWKGRGASAVLNDPQATRFYYEQCAQLARDGQLALAVLRDGRKVVAFEYGWQAGGIRGVLKIGYDESYSRCSPGQLLRWRLLEQLFTESAAGGPATVEWIDFVGPATRATEQWATHQYHVERLRIAASSWLPRLLVAGSQAAARLRSPPQAPHEIAADSGDGQGGLRNAPTPAFAEARTT